MLSDSLPDRQPPIVTDLHAQATYLVRSKYRRLVVAYAAFLAGFAMAALVLVFTLTLD